MGHASGPAVMPQKDKEQHHDAKSEKSVHRNLYLACAKRVFWYNMLMDNFVIEILSLCLSAMGGAILIMSIFTLMGKADILMDFERKHFAEKFLNKLAKIESAFGIVFSFLLFFCASAILFENPEKIQLAIVLLGIMVGIYLFLYIFLWAKNKKKPSR